MWSDLVHRVRAIFRRNLIERELDNELRFHMECQAEKYTSAGLSAEEAARRVRLEFGTLDHVKEEYRDSLGASLFETTAQDLRYTKRIIRRNPGFTMLAVLSLSIGIGANTAVFSVTDALLLKHLPVRNPEQLVSFTRTSLSEERVGNSFPYGLFEQFQKRSQAFSGVLVSMGSYSARMKLSDESIVGTGELVRAERVSSSFFSVLGVEPLLGRTFLVVDDRTAEPDPVVVISHALWQQRFGRDPGVLGRQITLNGVPFTVAGVARAGFFGVQVGQNPDIWWPVGNMKRIPQMRFPGEEDMLGGGVSMMARLRPGFTLEQAESESAVLYRQIMTAAAAADTEHGRDLLAQRMDVQSAATGIAESLRNRFTQPLVILIAAVGTLLLIVCTNIGGLLLVRGAARQKEISIRLALGSGRLRLIRQLLTESVVLAVIGGAGGLLVAAFGIRILLSYAAQHSNAALHAGLDFRVLAFAAMTSVLSAVIFGLAPALRATKPDLNPELKQASRSLIGGRSRLALNHLLVVSQIALSMVLLAGAGLLVRTLQNLRNVDAGFDKQQVVLFSVDRGTGLNPSPADAVLFRQMPSKFEAIPGVLSATLLVNYGLLGGNTARLRINVEGYVPRDETDLQVVHLSVGARFFETMGTPLLEGRDFGPEDQLENRRVAVINQAMAKYFFGDQSPIGRRVWGREVIGVAKNAKHSSLREQTPRTLYLGTEPGVYPGPAGAGIRFAVRTASNPLDLTNAFRGAVQQFDPSFQISNVETLNERAEATLVNERLLVRFAGAFSLVALLLACIGLYGTLSYAVAQRTNEIGVRMALGARGADVVTAMMRDTSRIVCTGLVIGLAGTLALSRLLASFLFGITPTDPLSFATAALLLIAAAAAAAYIPARKASRVDPLVALRHE